MGIQLIEACRVNKVKKVVVVGTICSYPKFTPVPFREEKLWTGYPEETNAPMASRNSCTLLAQLQSYRSAVRHERGVSPPGQSLRPARDDFDTASSHVIPALIRKIQHAIDTKASEVSVWGDGSATREFLYVDDAAEGIIMAAEKYDGIEPVNIGNGQGDLDSRPDDAALPHDGFQGGQARLGREQTQRAAPALTRHPARARLVRVFGPETPV